MQPTTHEPARESNTRLALRAFLRVAALVFLCVWGGLSGWWQLWLFLGLILLVLAANVTVMLLRNPTLLRERLKPDRPEKTWDKLVIAAMTLAMVGIFVVAGLDVMRFHWTVAPIPAIAIGAALVLAGDAIIAWCMGENPFLERTVRKQEERGHHVITTGPYRFVRHPMYTGFIVMTFGIALVLGSYLALAPALVTSVVLVVRTHFEDRALQDELEGYREYAARTRCRLIPSVW